MQLQHSRRIGTPKLLGPFGGEDDGHVGGYSPAVGMPRASTRLVSWEQRQEGPACRRVSDRIGVVIPSEQLRRRIVARLAVLGYHPRTVGSLKEALELVAAHDIDTLVLHASSFSTEVLSRFGRMMSGWKRIAFIASVSVVSVADGSRGNGADRSAQATGGAPSQWLLSTYWLPFAGLVEYSCALTGPRLN